MKTTIQEKLQKRLISGRRADPSNNDDGAEYQPAASLPWPDPLAPEAYHGLAGDLVRTIEPHSETDPAALLVQFLIAFGNKIGRTAHFCVEGTTHYLNEFVVLVGETSKARKGTSWGRVRQYVEMAAPEWTAERVKGGLASGEGMIHAVRDPVITRQPIKGKGGRIESYQEVETDEGVKDKRLLLIEEEFAGVLRLLERHGNSLSQRIREAWQGQPLGSLTKSIATRCKEPHISIVGHCTVEEIRRYLTHSEMANGFGNRHIWVCVRRSKCLPEGSRHSPDMGLVKRLQDCAAFASDVGEMRRDDDARKIWRGVYEQLSEGRPGMAGAMLGRAEAHVMRLACLYALLDNSCLIQGQHLMAALALWQYAESCVRYVFGDSTGDWVADAILRGLRQSRNGLSRTQISDLFKRNQPGNRIDGALATLWQAGLAKPEKVDTDGRSAEVWRATK